MSTSTTTSAFRSTLTAAPLLCTGRILDGIPDKATSLGAAFSVRRVYTAYVGPCMRVRRVPDNRELDIGFVQTELDATALESFASGFDCFVVTWYDQSGRGRHATQLDPRLQPQIVAAGSILFDTSLNQVSLAFNGAYLKTSWEPTPEEMAGGAGIMTAASVGLMGGPGKDPSVQVGRVSEAPTDVVLSADFPAPQLPADYGPYLLEGLQVSPDGSNVAVVFHENGNVHQLTVAATKDSFTENVDTAIPTPRGPPALTAKALPLTGLATATVDQWRSGILLNGRVFAVPYDSDVVLEISPETGAIAPLPLPMTLSEAATVKAKWWMAVANAAGTKAFCIPATYKSVLEIDASVTPATLRIVGDDFGALAQKWHEAARVGTAIFAVPHNAVTVLRIDVSGADPTTSALPFGFALSSGGGLWSSVAVANGTVWGIPWNAATALAINPVTNTVSLAGSTGMTPRIGTEGSGRGYTLPGPTLTVAAPDDPTGTRMQISAQVEVTSIVSSVTATAPGTGYTSTPTIQVTGLGDPTTASGEFQYGSFSVTAPVVQPVMALVDPAVPQLGYKVAGLTVTHGGDNLLSKPTLTVVGGKGRDARAQAVVVEGRVLLINIPPGSEGSGYVDDPVVQINGGGGTGATAVVTRRSDVATNLGGAGGGIEAVTMTNEGSGYTSTPTVTFVGGRGVDAVIAAADITMVQDGKVTGVTVLSAGGGYVVEPPEQAPSGEIIIALPGATAGGNPAGTRATARIASVGASGEILAIEVVNAGSGYVAAPAVTFRATGSGAGGAAQATFALDGKITGVSVTVPGTKYTRAPEVSGLVDRGGQGQTPGLAAQITIALEGSSSGSSATGGISPYATNINMPSGTGKFVGAYVPSGGGAIYSLPHWTHRVLRIDTVSGAVTDVLPPTGGARGFGSAFEGYKAGVATADGTAFYGLPWNRKFILKISQSGTAAWLPTSYNGRWSAGHVAHNGTIYAVPSEGASLLVIDPRQESRAELVEFPSLRGSQVANKWWALVPGGSTAGDGVLYGLPADASTVVELNPGTTRETSGLQSLPAAGCVLADQRRVVFAPGREKVVTVYDSLTRTATYHPIAAAGNVSYAESVALPDGNVIFVPTYSSTDAFAYAGNVGVFDSTSNVFSFGTNITVDYASPYPSRSAVLMGSQIGNGNLVVWVPRESTSPMVRYNHFTGGVDTSTWNRSDTRVRYASSRRVGGAADGRKAVVVQTRQTVVVESSGNPNYGYTRRLKFGGAALTGPTTNAVVLVPGIDTDYVTLFRPAFPGLSSDRLPAVSLVDYTRLEFPEDIRKSMVATEGMKYSGAVWAGGKVVAIPCQRTRVLSIDVTSATVEEYGDFESENAAVGGDMWYDGVLGADNATIYCAPYNARQVLSIDTSLQNPAVRASLVGSVYAGGGAKWRGGAVARNGKIFFAPHDATSVLVYDPATGTTALPEGLSTTNANTFPWLWGARKFSGFVAASDGLLYTIPYASSKIVAIDPDTLTVQREIDTQLVDVNGNRKFCAAFQAKNGRLYFVPETMFGVLQLDIFGEARDVVTMLGATIGWSCAAMSREGVIYGFPGGSTGQKTGYLRVTPGYEYSAIYDQFGDSASNPQWMECQRVPRPYKLRPHLMRDTVSLLYHSGAGPVGIFNSNNATASTFMTFGPAVRDGVSTHFPALGDRVLSAYGGNVAVVTPFQGTVGGVKSFSGTADLFLGVNGTDLSVAAGGATVVARSLFETIFDEGASGVYGGHASNAAQSLDLFVRDVPLAGATFAWTGQVGNTFGVGRVDGTLTPAFGAPASSRSFNGLVSELLVFSSDQRARGPTLGENAAFYFLDSKFQTSTPLV